MERPLLLVCNDDGFNYPGIHALIDVARQIGDVVVCCPAEHQSGMSSAITFVHPLVPKKIVDEPGYTVYTVNGTPTDCVKLAVGELLGDRKPDLTLCGVNHGYNHGTNAIYSGTMGCAFESLIHTIPSIAFSYGKYGKDVDMSACKPEMDRIIRAALEKGLPKGVCLNVNFPPRDDANYPGVKITKSDIGRWVQEFAKRTHPEGFDYYWVVGAYECADNQDDTTDSYWLARGYITVTPCKVDQTAYEAMQQVSQLLTP